MKIKLTTPQRVGLFRAVKGWLDGEKSFSTVKPEIEEAVLGSAIRTAMGMETDKDLKILFFFRGLPYTRDVDERKRAAQERAFLKLTAYLHLGDDMKSFSATEKKAALYDFILGYSVKKFNTGRKYDENGQLIYYRVEGIWIRFYDTSRGISGKVKNPAGTPDPERQIMNEYDARRYNDYKRGPNEYEHQKRFVRAIKADNPTLRVF